MPVASGYGEMKESGVEWIGEVPSNWHISPLKHLFSIKKEIAGVLGYNVLSVTQKGIIPKDMNNKGQFALDYSKYQLVQCGDFIMNHMDLLTGWVDISKYEGVTSPDYRVFVANKLIEIFPIYYKFIFQYCYSNHIFYGLGQGVAGFGRWRLPAAMFLNFILPVPPVNEQQYISIYLDAKCSTLDSIITEAKASIEEYKALKASVIYEAVTKGLDPDVKMKDSGVEWIGKMPSKWNLSRIKNEVINLDSLREPISAENRDNKLGLYDYYGASGVIDKIDDFNVEDTVLLIGEDGANLKMRNLPLVYRATGKFWVNNHAHILKVNENNSYSFMSYVLEAGDYSVYITGSAQPKLSQSNLMRFPIPMPMLREQKKIADYLDAKCADMDALIFEKQSLISDLEAYKKSLIFEVVTGKRKVDASV